MTFEEEQQAHAERLGYQTADEMNADHDKFHERLAKAVGLEYSPTLLHVRYGMRLDYDWVRYEEAMVLAAQKFKNEYHKWRTGTDDYSTSDRPVPPAD